MMSHGPQTFPALKHDHAACLSEALKRARAKCEAQGVKWTDLREKVYAAIAASHEPASAYDLIDKLAAQGKRLAPVSIYRILDVLQKVGLVHKIESRNAYFACLIDHKADGESVFFLCEDCGRVAERQAQGATAAISGLAHADDFIVKSTVLEVRGECEECHRRRHAQC